MDAHPAMTALWHASGFTLGPEEQQDAAYAYGLGLLLDGIERSVE